MDLLNDKLLAACSMYYMCKDVGPLWFKMFFINLPHLLWLISASQHVPRFNISEVV